MQLINGETHEKSALKSSLNRLWRNIVVNTKEVSSGEKKKVRAAMRLVYGVHGTSFGKCLVGVCEGGICHMSFFRSAPETHVEEFGKIWQNPQNQRDDKKVAEVFRGIFSPMEKQPPPAILLLGTRFQLRVWEKLLEVQEGETLSYSDLAESVGKPTAVRAVSNAVAGNPVAYLVPCHRIIGKTGHLHGYRWGIDIKKTMLKLEGATW